MFRQLLPGSCRHGERKQGITDAGGDPLKGSGQAAIAAASLGRGALLLALLLSGCTGTSARMNRIQVGMRRPDVVAALGRPHAISAQGTQEYLSYHLLAKHTGEVGEYVVRMSDGRVESFGRRTDYGANLLTNPPAMGPAGPSGSKAN